jgi:hypothetical protein
MPVLLGVYNIRITFIFIIIIIWSFAKCYLVYKYYVKFYLFRIYQAGLI